MTKLSVGASFVLFFLNPTACFYIKKTPAHGHINHNELTLCIFKQRKISLSKSVKVQRPKKYTWDNKIKKERKNTVQNKNQKHTKSF